MFAVTITTIQRPTACVQKLFQRLAPTDSILIAAGDTKGPDSFTPDPSTGFPESRLRFLPLDAQNSLSYRLARLLPTKHYCRKNLAYLEAIREGCEFIYETDDDNGPLENWSIRQEFVNCQTHLEGSDTNGPRWVNVYRHFTDQLIWPRGLPLPQIHTPFNSLPCSSPHQWAPIQQGLADGAPDVDAIWRLVLDKEFRFDHKESVLLPPGNWTPFNTQSTWWWPVAYPLLYIPSYCTFRMCDIWKSFVAQRCLWELGTGIVFHASEVWQERNLHSLQRDFEDEIPGYQLNHKIAQTLEAIPLLSGNENVGANLLRCYQSLVEHRFFPVDELPLVEAWLEDCQSVLHKP